MLAFYCWVTVGYYNIYLVPSAMPKYRSFEICPIRASDGLKNKSQINPRYIKLEIEIISSTLQIITSMIKTYHLIVLVVKVVISRIITPHFIRIYLGIYIVWALTKYPRRSPSTARQYPVPSVKRFRQQRRQFAGVAVSLRDRSRHRNRLLWAQGWPNWNLRTWHCVI